MTAEEATYTLREALGHYDNTPDAEAARWVVSASRDLLPHITCKNCQLPLWAMTLTYCSECRMLLESLCPEALEPQGEKE